jgi:hypothetical protein
LELLGARGEERVLADDELLYGLASHMSMSTSRGADGQRAKRDHGAGFDRLIREARDLHAGDVSTAPDAAQLAPKRYRPGNRPI